MAGGKRPAGEVLLVVNHEAVGAPVHPAGLGVLGDYDAPCAEVAPAIALVNQRRRQLGNVQLVALDDDVATDGVFHQGRVDGIRVAADVLGIDLGNPGVRRQTQRDGRPAPGGDGVHEDALAGIVLDVVENHRRAVNFSGAAADGAQFEVPVHLLVHDDNVACALTNLDEFALILGDSHTRFFHYSSHFFLFLPETDHDCP